MHARSHALHGRGAVGVLSAAFALNPIGIDCGTMPFDDDGDAVEKVGVDVALDGGLVLVFTEEDDGPLGNVVVPSYDPDDLPEDALERVVARRCLCRTCIAKRETNGLTFVIDDATRAVVETATLARLEAIGCTIGDAFADHGYAITCDGEALRVTFGTRATGTQVYLGY
ncbi:MAG: hypothetical protein P1P87_11690 [Trueperaceae bacterium]|nr:hypothetical protein [Trueperaceae bacterium]